MKSPVAVALALLGPVCWAAPATGSDECLRIAADLERVEKARNDAIERHDNAWKAVIPFVVIARKVRSKADIEKTDAQLLALRQSAEAEGCDAR